MTPTPTMSERLYELIRTGQMVKFYKTKEWLVLRQIALRRDNYECQMHRDKGKYHHAQCVHHIKEVKPYPHLALTLSNLMSLCNACHNEVHDRVGNRFKEDRFVSKEQW